MLLGQFKCYLISVKTYENMGKCFIMCLLPPLIKGMKRAAQVMLSFIGGADFGERSAPKYPEKLRDWYLGTAAEHSWKAPGSGVHGLRKQTHWEVLEMRPRIVGSHIWCLFHLPQNVSKWQVFLGEFKFLNDDSPISNVRINDLKVIPDGNKHPLEVWPFDGPNPRNIAF